MSSAALNHYSWVVTAYLLASTASTPLYGKIADLVGRRPVFLFSIGVFLVGSLLAGMSQDMTQLVATRGLQGLGAGGLMTLAFTIIVRRGLAPRTRPLPGAIRRGLRRLRGRRAAASAATSPRPLALDLLHQRAAGHRRAIVVATACCGTCRSSAASTSID